MLFSGWFGYAIFACSFLIFVSYQIIPNGLQVIEEHARHNTDTLFLLQVTSSPVFRAFIRFCGMDHIIMSGVMLSVAHGVVTVDPFWQWLLLISEGSVALVSIMSALAVWRVRWYLQKQR